MAASLVIWTFVRDKVATSIGIALLVGTFIAASIDAWREERMKVNELTANTATNIPRLFIETFDRILPIFSSSYMIGHGTQPCIGRPY